MSEPLLATPADGWTTDDLDQLPVSNYRYELTDGALTVPPSPTGLHQYICARLTLALESQAPAGIAVTQAVEVRFAHKLTRIPDVLAVTSTDLSRHWLAPDEVVLAVEVESPGNHIEDRTTKPAIYAQFGIPHYWRIDPRALTVTAYRLDPDPNNNRVAEPSERLVAHEPFPATLAVSDLLPRADR